MLKDIVCSPCWCSGAGSGWILLLSRGLEEGQCLYKIQPMGVCRVPLSTATPQSESWLFLFQFCRKREHWLADRKQLENFHGYLTLHFQMGGHQHKKCLQLVSENSARLCWNACYINIRKIFFCTNNPLKAREPLVGESAAQQQSTRAGLAESTQRNEEKSVITSLCG